jgi:hypothetical protein
VGLKLNGTNRLLVFADDVNLLGDNIDTIKRNTHTLIEASKVIGLEVNIEETKYTLLYRHQNSGQNHDLRIANRCLEDVEQFRYLGMVITIQNLIQEEIKRRLNLCKLATIQSRMFYLLVCCLKTKIRIYKTIILPVVLYECETWSVTLRKEHRLRVF